MWSLTYSCQRSVNLTICEDTTWLGWKEFASVTFWFNKVQFIVRRPSRRYAQGQIECKFCLIDRQASINTCSRSSLVAYAVLNRFLEMFWISELNFYFLNILTIIKLLTCIWISEYLRGSQSTSPSKRYYIYQLYIFIKCHARETFNDACHIQLLPKKYVTVCGGWTGMQPARGSPDG